jgi:hypothetical protein
VTEQNPYSPPQAELAPPAVEVVGPGRGPRGIGGWLVLPLLGLLFTPVKVLLDMREFGGLFEPGTWAALTTPGTAAYHPLWAPTIIFEIVVNVAYVGLTVLALVLFLKKSRRVPRVMTIWLATPILVQGIDMLLTAQIPALTAAGGGQAGTDLVRSAVAAAVWIPYFHSSVRVKNTFVS